MTEEELLQSFLKQLKIRLQEIEDRHGYLTFLIENRFANEKLVQLETMHIISQNPEVVDYLPEKLYDPENKEKCDFWFKIRSGTEFWMEIKTRPTNYRKPGHAKAITNSVDEVIEDVQRLKRVKGDNIRRLVLFAFYPIYSGSYDTFNKVHLQRISQKMGKNAKGPKIQIKIGQADFNLYFEEV